jgi:hypothetical protein
VDTVAALTLDALSAHGTESLSGYAACLRAACLAVPPPFGEDWYGDKYRAVSEDPQWLAASLVANAQVEGDGARKLWNLVSRTGDGNIAAQVRVHAVDESRHARLYIAMLDIAFPDAVSEELRPALSALSPGYTVKDRPTGMEQSPIEWVHDEIIQMNLGEIRTRIHQLLLRPVLRAWCAEPARPRLQRVLDSLLRDETLHIQYTARLIEQMIQEGAGDFVRQTMAKRLAEFNDITLTEVGLQRFVGE